MRTIGGRHYIKESNQFIELAVLQVRIMHMSAVQFIELGGCHYIKESDQFIELAVGADQFIELAVLQVRTIDCVQ